MEFIDIVRTRRSIRQYTDQIVPEETIHELLEIIGFSVSAINLQPWKIKVVSDRRPRRSSSRRFRHDQVRDCSHLLVLCADVDYPTIIDRLDKAQAAAGVPDEMRESLHRAWPPNSPTA